MDGRRWTRRTTRSIADQLRRVGIAVGASTVARLLHQMGFSLKTNRKNIESGVKRTPEDRERRNRQILLIKAKRRQFEAADLPVISVDGKKRELIGNFKNNGRTWRETSREVNDHDFLTDASGVALSYGIYDTRRNHGTVVVGTSRATPAFAVDAIEYWWKRHGKKHYRHAKELLVLADSGGANGSRSTVWKADLQQLCNAHGLTITVCHYPPGASKWNPIEHRLFSEISKNWQGVPLESYETALKYIRTTKTRTGLKVNAVLHRKTYQTGEKATDVEMDLLNIKRHRTLPDWTYTISPYSDKQRKKM